MAKQDILYTQSWVTLHNAGALVYDSLAKTGDAFRWKKTNNEGVPIAKNGFHVPPGSKVDLAKLSAAQAEKLTSTAKKATPALLSTPPNNPPRTAVIDSATRIRAPKSTGDK